MHDCRDTLPRYNAGMRFLFTLTIAILAFGAGVWYMGGFDETTSPEPTAPTTTQTQSATYQNADSNMIVVSQPAAGARVGNTFTVSGQARGGWYFEASFPLRVFDSTGTELVVMPVQAGSDWMTPNFVPFTVQVLIPGNYKGSATLVLHNDNPSGLPENDASITIPIVIQ